ncbi:YfiR family protein [Nitrosomonas sp.]|uniref:YfiR family protein n=1 Tax=Nitrosomonas sp. TaxID=42353 RepID=UPI0025DF0FAB|nr:YfiR family protein [Nitrosomonas sp.]
MRELTQQFKLLNTSIWRCIGRFLLIILCSFGLPISHPVAKADNMLEYQVKAAFIYNFIAFTQWPENTDPVINLCLYGVDYFGQEIDKLQNRAVGTQSIKVMHINSINQLQQCQVIFFSKSTDNALASIVNSLQNRPILTLADTPNAISRGIIINMNLINEKIVFEINLANARKSGLDISSKLLQLATKVHQ